MIQWPFIESLYSLFSGDFPLQFCCVPCHAKLCNNAVIWNFAVSDEIFTCWIFYVWRHVQYFTIRTVNIVIKIKFIIRFLVLIVTSRHPITVSFFSPSIMASFHRHRCWLLCFVIFLCFLIVHECEHSLGLLIILKEIFWAIILSLFMMVVSFPAQCCRFTFTVVGY